MVDRGIMLAGGGALVRGIMISHETGIFVHRGRPAAVCRQRLRADWSWKRLQRVVDTPEFIRSSAGT